jgi:hypothetical protein
VAFFIMVLLPDGGTKKGVNSSMGVARDRYCVIPSAWVARGCGVAVALQYFVRSTKLYALYCHTYLHMFVFKRCQMEA